MCRKGFMAGAIALFSVWPAVVWGAGVYFEQETKTEYKVGAGEEISKVSHQKIYAREDMFKLEQVETGEISIIRMDKNLVYHLDRDKKTYQAVDLKQLKFQQGQEDLKTSQASIQKQMARQLADQNLQKLMAGMPPQQQALMMAQRQKMISGQEESTTEVGEAIKVAMTGEKKTLLGHEAERIKFSQGNKMLLEMWVTTKIGPQNYVTDFMETAGVFSQDVIRELNKLHGFPLEMKYRVLSGHSAGALQMVRLTKLESREIPSLDFELPAGYQETIVPKEEKKEESW